MTLYGFDINDPHHQTNSEDVNGIDLRPNIFPNTTRLSISINAHNCALLLRLFPPSVVDFELILYEPWPSSYSLNRLLNDPEDLRNLQRLTVVYNDDPGQWNKQDRRREALEAGHMDIPWIARLLRRLPDRSSLRVLKLEGCFLTADVYTEVVGLEKLDIFEAEVCPRTMNHCPAAPLPTLEAVLGSLSKQLQGIRLGDLDSPEGFDVTRLASFDKLTALNLYTAGRLKPPHFVALQSLVLLETVIIRFPTLPDILDSTTFRSLLRSWPSLQYLVLGVPQGHAMTPLPEKRTIPVRLHLRDLAILGEHSPRLRGLKINVDTRSSGLLVEPSYPLCNRVDLDFSEIALAKDDAKDAINFIQQLFTDIGKLQVGDAHGPWKPLLDTYRLIQKSKV